MDELNRDWRELVQEFNAGVVAPEEVLMTSQATDTEPAPPPSEPADEEVTKPELGNRPINKYFCNLMNAIGVKAGADGFPAKGGTAEVTHYGYSDKTEDFCGGQGAVPDAKIHDPGGYDELRA